MMCKSSHDDVRAMDARLHGSAMRRPRIVWAAKVLTAVLVVAGLAVVSDSVASTAGGSTGEVMAVSAGNTHFAALGADARAALVSVLASATTASQPRVQIRHVDALHGSARGDGRSWLSAYQCLDRALAEARFASANQPFEIWIARGVYRPGGGSADRHASFELLNHTVIYGGFAGTETRRDQRDWQRNVTVLSGDLAGNDLPLDAPWDRQAELDCIFDPECVFNDNSFLVVNDWDLARAWLYDELAPDDDG